MFVLSISENILFYVSGIGVIQAVFLIALLLFYPRSDRSVNIFLASYLGIMSAPIIIPVVPRIFSWQVYIFIEPFLAFSGPFLYLYVRSFKEVITWRKAWPHYIFFVVSVLLAVWIYIAIGRKYPPADEVPAEIRRNILLLTPFSLRLIQRIIYYFLSRKELRNYQRTIQHLFSDTSRINLNWVKWIINGYLFLILMTIALYWLIINYPANFNLWLLGSGAIVTIYIYIAAFKGITQVTLWQMHPNTDKEKLEEKLKTTETDERSSAKASFSNNRLNEIVSQVIHVMEKENLYQEPDLSLQQLSEKIGVPYYQVSMAINDGLKKTFYDLVNGYRVEEAKRLLREPGNKNHTILSVGFEAGFNSKTSFNTVFKKFTGLTPTEYRSKQNENTP